jgi:hypothetical protein
LNPELRGRALAMQVHSCQCQFSVVVGEASRLTLCRKQTVALSLKQFSMVGCRWSVEDADGCQRFFPKAESAPGIANSAQVSNPEGKAVRLTYTDN